MGGLRRSFSSRNCTNWPSSSSVRAILPYANECEEILVIVFIPHAQRERGKVIRVGVHNIISECTVVLSL